MMVSRHRIRQCIPVWGLLLFVLSMTRWSALVASAQLNIGVVLLSHATTSQEVDHASAPNLLTASQEWLRASLSYEPHGTSLSHLAHVGIARDEDVETLLSSDECERLESQSDMCWYWVGVDAERRGDFALMAEAWEKAGGVDLLLSKCQREGSTRQEFQALLAVCKRLATLQPDSLTAHWTLGIAYGALDQPQQAIIEYQSALTLDPGNPYVLNRLAGIHLRLGQWDEALRRLELPAALLPDDAWVHCNLARVYREKGEYGLAISHAQKAVELDPTLLTCYRCWADTLWDAKRFKEAVEVYLYILQRWPSDELSAKRVPSDTIQNEP